MVRYPFLGECVTVAIATSICEMRLGVGTFNISQSRRAFNPILGDQQNPLQPEKLFLVASGCKTSLDASVSMHEQDSPWTDENSIYVKDSWHTPSYEPK